MGARLRQIALVARELEPRSDELCGVFGLEVGYRDPGVGEFGLHNVVVPVGDTFLEIVSPIAEGTTAGRYLDRIGGDGGYMVILQLDDLDAARRRVQELGIRVVWQADHDDMRGTHLHPRDIGGAIVSLDDASPVESWRWAGPEWRIHVRQERVATLCGVEIASSEPEALAQRWGRVLATPSTADREGAWRLELETSEMLPPESEAGAGVIRFRRQRDGEPEGVREVDLVGVDPAAVLRAAAERGLASGEDGEPWVELCGVRFRLR